LIYRSLDLSIISESANLYLENTLIKNFDFTRLNGYWGYDADVFWHLPFNRRYTKNKNLLNRVFRRIEYEALMIFPDLIKPYLNLLKIDKELTPYGLGLFLQAYSNMYRYTNEEIYILEMDNVFKLLQKNFINLPNGLGVGSANNKYNEYKKFFNTITTNDTSYLVCCAEVMFGLLNYFYLTNNSEVKITIEKIANSLNHDYQFKSLDDDRGILNYSNADDNTHIFNANVLAMKAMIEAHNNGLANLDLKRIKKIFNFTWPYTQLKEIQYAGNEDRLISSNYQNADLYHTGFTLRGMLAIAIFFKMENEKNYLFQKMHSTLDDFVINGKISIFQNKNLSEIHSVAEYIQIYCSVFEMLDDVMKKKYLDIIIHNIHWMNDGKGSYFYKRFNKKKIEIYFPRWSHSVMMNSISNLLLKLNKDNR
jgi:hypothetical protein